MGNLARSNEHKHLHVFATWKKQIYTPMYGRLYLPTFTINVN